MQYPESVLTKNRKGNIEIRNLVSRGNFVMYDYRDPKSFKQVENRKRKLYLKNKDGKTEEYYIIPLKTKNKSLLIAPERIERKSRKVWNEKIKKEENLWK